MAFRSKPAVLLWQRVSAKTAGMITITDLSARIAGRLLLDQASVTLPAGSKAGLVGRKVNGVRAADAFSGGYSAVFPE